MHLAEIIVGCLLCAAAVIALYIALADGTVIALGVAVVLGGLGGFGVYSGAHGYHAEYQAKHDAILRDLTGQGFWLASDDVFAVGGNHFDMTTEVDLPVGNCSVPFITAKIAGVWRIVVPNRGVGAVALTPADVARVAHACR